MLKLYILVDGGAGGGDYDALNLVTPDPSREVYSTLDEAKLAKGRLLIQNADRDGEGTQDIDIYELNLIPNP